MIHIEWVASESGATVETRNPADQTEIIGEIQESTEADVERAITAATAAQADWGETPGPARGAILREAAELLAERKDDLTETLVREEGKA